MIKLHFTALKKAFFYSRDGLMCLFQERAFKEELWLGLFLLIAEFFRNDCSYHLFIIRAYIFSAYIIVLITESLNTAIETVINRIGPERNELSKKAKDIGSAAVFIALIHFGIVWLISWFL